jgi:alpha-D-ribose 1-methylphosphonate 5-triphosphate diphosphatase
VAALVEEVDVDLVSVMHHAPGGGQYDAESFERHYVEDRNWPAEAARSAAAERSGMDDASRDRRIARVRDLARRVGAPLASHDDECRGDVETMAAHGAAISEYPLTLDAARRAKSLGLATVMGAPNLVRGGSLWDNLSARDAIEAGVLDALCSDYHPASLLAAPFVDTGESLSTRVNRVTRNPADVAGLPDRGRIEVGARADVVVVDPSPTPTVERVFVAGTEAIRTGGGAAPEPRVRSETR